VSDEPGARGRKGRTATYRFGASRREAHDSREFYARFAPPQLDAGEELATEVPRELLVCGDSRTMRELPDRSVALVVTSPPYFVGKEYEAAVGQGSVPASYLDYLGLLRDVFAEAVRVLEPGGRIAVNVANLGRKPYRSLAADVIGILQDDLGLLLRGEVIWQKGIGASNSCAWGSYRSPANPVLRDLTARVVVASKGRFDRARSSARRQREGRPWERTIAADEFLAATLDLWQIPAESARRVGHPAPFPVELPRRLIELYTYRDDLVLDPFLGAGSSAVAALRAGRRFAGYDLDPGYVALARQRLADERARLAGGVAQEEAYRSAAVLGGTLEKLAAAQMEAAGFRELTVARTVGRGLGLTASLAAWDATGEEWCCELVGAFSVVDAGLASTDTLWKTLGRLTMLHRHLREPLLLLASRLPPPGSPADRLLRSLGPDLLFDAVELLQPAGVARLQAYARHGRRKGPQPGFWTAPELARLTFPGAG